MAMRSGPWMVVVAGILLMSGCGDAVLEATCATDSGARVCVTQKSSALRYDVRATGFKPNSDVQMTPEGASAGALPLRLQIGADGMYSNGGGVLGIVGGPGTPAVTTLMFSGMTESGAAVSIPVMLKRL